MLTLTFIIDPNGAGNHSVEMATSTTLLRARELIDRELEHRARAEHWSLRQAREAVALMAAAREGRASYSEALAAKHRTGCPMIHSPDAECACDL